MEAALLALPEEERPPDTSHSSITRWERSGGAAPAAYLVFLVKRTGADLGELLLGVAEKNGGGPTGAGLVIEAIETTLAEWRRRLGLPPANVGDRHAVSVVRSGRRGARREQSEGKKGG